MIYQILPVCLLPRPCSLPQVVTLLRDLQTQVTAEGTEEATTYDTFACHCKDTTESKVRRVLGGPVVVARITVE